MRRRLLALVMFASWTLVLPVVGGAESPPNAALQVVQVEVNPAKVVLSGPRQRFTLLVSGRTADGQTVDLTGLASYRSSAPEIVAVSRGGVLTGNADGTATVEIAAAGTTASVSVTVRDAGQLRKFNFENDIEPVLGRYGCNASGCHGKADGQNGFKLSVFGFDPTADYDALAKEGRGRRVFPAAPHKSLLLRKAAGLDPHGGGARIAPDSPAYQTLHDWIAAGLPFGAADDARVVAIELTPREVSLRLASQGAAEQALGTTQQLRVLARYSDGREEDVTALARFQSNNDGLASVDEGGRISAGRVPGQAAVMASYMNCVDVCRVLLPRPEPIAQFPKLPAHNFIDEHVHRRLAALNILPSDLADDADFLRRVCLDLIGTLPTAAEARAFLADDNPNKRGQLVESLFQRPEFADYWALYWADLLRVDREKLGHKKAYAFYAWLHEHVRRNTPLVALAREILLAEGPLVEAPQAAFYLAHDRPGDTASAFAQVFLGVRIACAECHHHPFDRWSQQDYLGMEAFFAQVQRKNTSLGEALFAEGDPASIHPRTRKPVFPHPLGGSMPPAAPPGDRRLVLSQWLSAPDNGYFARNIVNRAWALLMGRGLVEPVDDFRDTNPPTNPELLDALARDFVAHGYDFQHLLRTITASRTYQQSSRPNATNRLDEQNYSRALMKRPSAEVLFDAICQVTGVREKFRGVPDGPRAIQLWDSQTPHYFLNLFGRPLRKSTCECERSGEASLSQVLHLLNSPEIQQKLAHEAGRVAQLVQTHRDDGQLVEELYLTFYARFPSDEESAVAVAHLRNSPAGRRRAAEDLAWSLMNSLEFVFNH